MFNLSFQNIEHLALERFPNLTVTSSALRRGRVTVSRKSQGGSGHSRPFYLTKQVQLRKNVYEKIVSTKTIFNERLPGLWSSSPHPSTTKSLSFSLVKLGWGKPLQFNIYQI